MTCLQGVLVDNDVKKPKDVLLELIKSVQLIDDVAGRGKFDANEESVVLLVYRICEPLAPDLFDSFDLTAVIFYRGLNLGDRGFNLVIVQGGIYEKRRLVQSLCRFQFRSPPFELSVPRNRGTRS